MGNLESYVTTKTRTRFIFEHKLTSTHLTPTHLGNLRLLQEWIENRLFIFRERERERQFTLKTFEQDDSSDDEPDSGHVAHVFVVTHQVEQAPVKIHNSYADNPKISSINVIREMLGLTFD